MGDVTSFLQLHVPWGRHASKTRLQAEAAKYMSVFGLPLCRGPRDLADALCALPCG